VQSRAPYLRNFTIPSPPDPGDPYIALNRDVPPTLTDPRYTFTGAIVWYFDPDAPSYYFEASAVRLSDSAPCMVIGTYDTVQGVEIISTVPDPLVAIDRDITMGDTTNDALTTWIYERGAVDIGSSGAGDEQLRVRNRIVVPQRTASICRDSVAHSTNVAGFAVIDSVFDITLDKLYDTTGILVRLNIGGFCTVAGTTGVTYQARAIQATGATVRDTQPIAKLIYPVINQHQYASGEVLLLGGGTMPADTYTITIRWARFIGAGTCFTDANDMISVSAQETLA
jgi:hypothetical protein